MRSPSATGSCLTTCPVCDSPSWMTGQRLTNAQVEVLTHVNLAFASIDASTYSIVPMDESLTTDVFQNFANIKSVKPDIQAFVSVGGWSFSDNDTKTQPIFGDIAASAEYRQQFANNVVDFLNEYALDGIDIDW